MGLGWCKAARPPASAEQCSEAGVRNPTTKSKGKDTKVQGGNKRERVGGVGMRFASRGQPHPTCYAVLGPTAELAGPRGSQAARKISFLGVSEEGGKGHPKAKTGAGAAAGGAKNGCRGGEGGRLHGVANS